MPRLLIAFDGSEASRSAVRASAGLFPGAEAVILFAHEDLPPFERVLVHSGTADPALVRNGVDELAREITKRADAIAEQGVKLATEGGLAATAAIVATKGGAWPEVLEVARERDADVVVCGTRGRGRVGRALLGSTATSLLHHADLPVLVVPDGEFIADGPVLIAYDGSDDAKGAIATAATLFPGRAAVLLHGWRAPLQDPITGRAFIATPVDEVRAIAQGFTELTRADAQAVADEGAGIVAAHGLEVSTEIVTTRRNAWRPLIEAADAADAAVVVAGSRGMGGIASTVVGSVSSALVNNAERPTLIVRPPKAT